MILGKLKVSEVTTSVGHDAKFCWEICSVQWVFAVVVLFITAIRHDCLCELSRFVFPQDL